MTGSLVVYERPKLSWTVCSQIADELLELRTVEAELLAAARVAAPLSGYARGRGSPTGSDSTTRNRKKLKQTTKTSVAERAENLAD